MKSKHTTDIVYVHSNVVRGVAATLVNKETGKVERSGAVRSSRKLAKDALFGRDKFQKKRRGKGRR